MTRARQPMLSRRRFRFIAAPNYLDQRAISRGAAAGIPRARLRPGRAVAAIIDRVGAPRRTPPSRLDQLRDDEREFEQADSFYMWSSSASAVRARVPTSLLSTAYGNPPIAVEFNRGQVGEVAAGHDLHVHRTQGRGRLIDR
jgi:hypothetical protein